jgi:hypothetical protein
MPVADGESPIRHHQQTAQGPEQVLRVTFCLADADELREGPSVALVPQRCILILDDRYAGTVSNRALPITGCICSAPARCK